jgi:hypothetical protein
MVMFFRIGINQEIVVVYSLERADMNIDKKLENIVIRCILEEDRADKEARNENENIIQVEEEYLEQELQKGGVRDLIQEHVIKSLTKEEKDLWLKYEESGLREKLINGMVKFVEEFLHLQMEDVVEQSDYSQNKTRH